MTKKILITGATGFVGKQVITALSNCDVQLDLVVHNDKNNVFNEYKNIRFIITTADLFDESEAWWSEVCKDVNMVIHIAWYVEPGKYLESPLNEHCLKGTIALARACLEAGVEKFCGIGTCFEYDLDLGYLSIDSPLKPVTSYAIAKTEAFLRLSEIFLDSKTHFIWCRLFYLFGKGEDERRLVPYLRNRLSNGEIANLTDGKKVRDFMDIEEAGKKIVEATLSPTVGPFNVCSGKGITIRDLAERIADEYGRRDLLSFGSYSKNKLDPSFIVGIKTELIY